MKNYFYNEIKNFKGNVIIINTDDYILKLINNNNKINAFSITNESKGKIFKRNKIKLDKNKSINFKKLHKYFRKKSIDYIIINITELLSYLKYFVRDSIYLNCNKLYIYSETDDIDIDFIIKKYKRYNVKLSKKMYSTGFILIIDNKNSKNKRIKEKFYFIIDTLINLVDFISNVLIS